VNNLHLHFHLHLHRPASIAGNASVPLVVE
jgi:hypothetical protein